MTASVPTSLSDASSVGDVDPKKNGIAAASLIIFDTQRCDDSARLLFVERSDVMRFAPGAVVWPGGRVDEDDHALARKVAPHLEPGDAAARIASIRETVEETGLLVAIAGRADSMEENLRSSLAEGEGFATWLDRRGWTLDLDRLVQFARWDPRFRERRAFDTRFFVLALNSDGHHAVRPDGTENKSAFWATADEVLGDVENDRRSAIFPTVRNLERLCRLPDAEAARISARQYGHITITPEMLEDEDGRWLTIPDYAGYPITRISLDAARRG